MSNEHIFDYKARLKKELTEFMALPVTEASAKAIKGMIECMEAVDRTERCGFFDEAPQLTDEDLHAWVSEMENADGTVGAHWTEAQTNSIAQAIDVAFGEVSAAEFWAAMNMMYSDYAPAGLKYGVDRPEFYADLAKEFLFDKDGPGPSAKLAAYYNTVVK